MSAIVEQKLAALRSRLASRKRDGALLVVYPPEDELDFRVGYEEIITELQTGGDHVEVIDCGTLAFEALESAGILQKAFKLDAAGDQDAYRNIARLVQEALRKRVHTVAAEAPDAILCCWRTASLYPWVSYSALIEETENRIPNTLVIPFPGEERGPELHLLNLKDGYNYRASRI